MKISAVVVEIHNDLELCCGTDIKVSDDITIIQPTVRDIANIGEKKYFTFCQNITAHHLDDNIIVFLTNLGIDFNSITDWELFVNLSFTFEQDVANLIFRDLNFTTMQPFNNKDGELCLSNKDGVIITEEIYKSLVGYVRKLNNIPAPQYTKILDNPAQRQMAIDAAKRNIQTAIRREQFYPTRSILLPIISSVVVYCHWTFDEVLDMKLFRFWEVVKRVQALDSANHLFTGLYSGCVSFKENPSLKKDLDWMRELK